MEQVCTLLPTLSLKSSPATWGRRPMAGGRAGKLSGMLAPWGIRGLSQCKAAALQTLWTRQKTWEKSRPSESTQQLSTADREHTKAGSRITGLSEETESQQWNWKQKRECYSNPKNGHQDFKAERNIRRFSKLKFSCNVKKQIARISLALRS